MILPFTHPASETLVAFAEGTLPPRPRARTAQHVQRCVRCQAMMRFLHRLEVESARLAAPEPPAELLEQVLAQRAAGERAILARALPHLDESRPPGAPAWLRWSAAAAAVLVVASVALLGSAPDLTAIVQDSELVLTPDRPRQGDAIHVRYKPPPTMFEREDALALRARLRTATHAMYNEGVPVHEVATLRRTGDGTFEGTFRLGDDVVFASLAVEDTAARRVDTNSGRLWEVLLYADDGRPRFESLVQRLNDMMGRSWEEGYATSRRMTELYPDVIESWHMRLFFERSLLGEEAALAGESARRLDALTAAARGQARIDQHSLGTIFYLAFGRVISGGSASDSAEVQFWWQRLRREYPRHPQVAQRIAVDVGRLHWERPQRILDSLERVHAEFAPLTGPGRTLALVALQAANRLGDDEAAQRWYARWLTGRADSLVEAALSQAARTSQRTDGMNALRHLLSLSDSALMPVRALDASRQTHRQRVEHERRRVASALGRALIASGAIAAGRDTLLLAAEGAWDVELFRDLRAAFLLAGDSIQVERMSVRLAVDPRTPEQESDSMVRQLRTRLGEERWNTERSLARREMHERLLARSLNRAPRGTPRVLVDDRERTLRDVVGRTPAVIVLWSRNCGAAVEALPRIQRVVEQLQARGTPVLVVSDEPVAGELSAFLAERKVKLPLYQDVAGSTRAAFSGFGTPAYYVVDAAGRIRFSEVSVEEELLAQVEAVENEGRLASS